MTPPLTRDDEEQLARVVRLLVDVVREDVVGAYLFGSATAGGLQRDSDLDVLAVVRGPLGPTVRQALLEGLATISGALAPGGRLRRVELTVVERDQVRPWHHPARRELQYGDWLRAALDAGDPTPFEPTVDPDLALLLTMTMRSGRTLLGPPAADVLDPVPPADVLRAIDDALDGLLVGLEQDEDVRNVVLTLARMWVTVATGEIRSKDGAADWALERLPPEQRAVLARARAGYLCGGERWDDLRPRLRPFAEHVLAEIRAGQAPVRSAPGS